MNKEKIVVVSGGFDPIHSGHIHLINEAKLLGDRLIVLLNSDQWLTNKKGKPFMSFFERETVLSSLESVDTVMSFDDSDGTACHGLQKIKGIYPTHSNEIIFCNGGDRNNAKEIPESEIDEIVFEFGVGGDYKMNSSSEILEQYTNTFTKRDWGQWDVLKNYPKFGVKVKELVIKPGQSTSLQRHEHRSELMLVAKGTLYNQTQLVTKHEHIVIHKGDWHKLENFGKEDLHIVEIQFGDKCEEQDIERKDNE